MYFRVLLCGSHNDALLIHIRFASRVHLRTLANVHVLVRPAGLQLIDMLNGFGCARVARAT